MARIHWTFPAAVLCLVGALLSGCVLLGPSSPSTTVVDASGREVTLHWEDYPADGAHEPADVLAAPRAEEVEAAGESLLGDLRAAIDELAPGLSWQRDGESGIYPSEQNGYGGPSLHRLHNSASATTDTAPDDWAALTAALDGVLADHGYSPIVWSWHRGATEWQSAAERDASIIDQHGTLDPDAMWMWDGTAQQGSMWVSIVVQDPERGAGPAAGAPPRGDELLSLAVGGMVISADDEQAYRDGVAPFEGLERPTPAES
ncbi:hypothetical protein AA0Z99_10455 [Agrococcus sp. 1P02AA]|uniref:hypothetical protein n=1 Tax=Agrococcus sp. 1P02AA TaxID=3132259 RepID=UPI0039A75187